jgi:hypothetical protein
MDRILINLLGIGLEIFVIMVFFETFWVMKKLKRYKFICGFLLLAAMNTFIILITNNEIIRIVAFCFIVFSLCFYFISRITYKILLSIVATAIMFAAEVIINSFAVQRLNIQAERIQNDLGIYMVGVITSKLFALFLVYIVRFFMKKNQQEPEGNFNLLMAFMPIQSIILCFIFYRFSVNSEAHQPPTIEMAAVVFSLFLLFVVMFVLNNQSKALADKKEYEKAQVRLVMQIDHYQKLYQAHHEMRLIRHDISNNLIAISGMLKKGLVNESLDYINGINADIKKTEDIVDTGLPPIDAVISVKISKAKEHGIDLDYSIKIYNDLYIDQFDVAMIIANALDNAIEGVLRSTGIDSTVLLDITSKSDYISILVENYASGPIYEDLRTSKPDNKNHGFGIAQMKAVAHKYNGDLQAVYDLETRRFSLKVLLKNHHIKSFVH